MGDGKFGPAPGDADYERYNEWLHYAEGSAMLPFLLALYTRMLGDAAAPLQPRIVGEITNHLTYVAKGLGANQYFVGDSVTGVDFQMIFVLEAANVSGALDQIPNLKAYLERMQARDGYKRALERGGPYQLGG